MSDFGFVVTVGKAIQTMFPTGTVPLLNDVSVSPAVTDVIVAGVV